MYTGFRTFEVDGQLIEDLHLDGKVLLWDNRLATHPNMYVELRDVSRGKHTALGKVDYTGKTIEKISSGKVSGIEPRNREQVFAMNALMNPDITVVVLTGIAGSGKTLLALAAAMELINNRTYDKVMLTRPMSEVGKYKLGALPGDLDEKFGPYLLNYMTNLEQFVSGRYAVRDLIEQSKFDIVPLQLIRGASFNKCLVIADEVQVLGHTEILTLGTRIGEGSKVVIMGDLNQRDERISKDKTGIYKLMNDAKIKTSPIAATIGLQKCERSETARLISRVFEEK